MAQTAIRYLSSVVMQVPPVEMGENFSPGLLRADQAHTISLISSLTIFSVTPVTTTRHSGLSLFT